MSEHDDSAPSDGPGVWLVDAEALADLLNSTCERVFVLDSSGIASRGGFFSAVRDQLPQDPPLGTGRDVWDAMSDSLFGGFHSIDATAIALVWNGAHALRDNAPRDFQMAVAVLQQVASTLANPEFTAGRPTILRVFVA